MASEASLLPILIISGSGKKDVVVTTSSQLINSWLIVADETSTSTASTWEVTPTVNSTT